MNRLWLIASFFLFSVLLQNGSAATASPVARQQAEPTTTETSTDDATAQVTASEAVVPKSADSESQTLSFSETWTQYQNDISNADGIDAKIDVAFTPIADYWESLVLTPMKVAGVDTPIVLVLLVSGAAFFTVYFAFVNIRRFPLAIQVVFGKYDAIEQGGDPVTTDNLNVVDGDIVDTIRKEGHSGEVSHFQALATAVSGTVGLGNIGSVAIAVAAGGPGATFWMIVCGLLGMSSKFVECTLGVTYRDIAEDGTVYGGHMYYLRKGLDQMGLTGYGKFFGILFAVLCVGASFGGGNVFQSNQATKQILAVMDDFKSAPAEQTVAAGTAAVANTPAEPTSEKFITGLVLAVLVALVIIGGIKRIANVTEKIVPFMAILYVLSCVVVLIMNFQFLGVAIQQIFTEAFTPRAGVGGILGVMIKGFQRAAFSNEAGAGSAAIAHSAVKTRYPASEGIVALLEPFIDTVVICTMTALVIVSFNLAGDGMFQYGSSTVILKDGTSVDGVNLTSAAFEASFGWFKYVLTVAVVLFAFSTMISWSYYGLQSWKYLFGRSKFMDLFYKIIFLCFVIVGAAAKTDAAVKFSDAMILALVFPNMVGLFLLAPVVRKELNKYLDAIGVKRFLKS